MQKVKVSAILGTVFVVCAILLMCLAFFHIVTSAHLWILYCVAIVCLGFGSYLLVHARQLHTAFLAIHNQTPQDSTIPKHMSLIDMQRQLSAEWEETTTKRDKLKMLKLASADES